MSQFILDALGDAQKRVQQLLAERLKGLAAKYNEEFADCEERLKRYIPTSPALDPEDEAQNLLEVIRRYETAVQTAVKEFEDETKEIAAYQQAVKAGKRIGEAAARS